MWEKQGEGAERVDMMEMHCVKFSVTNKFVCF